MFRTYKELDHRSHVDLYRLLRRTRSLTISVFMSREIASSRGTGGQLLVSRKIGHLKSTWTVDAALTRRWLPTTSVQPCNGIGFRNVWPDRSAGRTQNASRSFVIFGSALPSAFCAG